MWNGKSDCLFGRAEGGHCRVMPVMTNDDAPPLGVIVFGLSPRLYWTEAYAMFLNLLTKQISTGLSIVMGYEAEVCLFSFLFFFSRF